MKHSTLKHTFVAWLLAAAGVTVSPARGSSNLTIKQYYQAAQCILSGTSSAQTISAGGQVMNQSSSTATYSCPVVRGEGFDSMTPSVETITLDGYANASPVTAVACRVKLNGGNPAEICTVPQTSPPASVYHMSFDILSFPATDFVYINITLPPSTPGPSYNVVFGYTLTTTGPVI